MPQQIHTLTPEQVKEKFRARGMTLKQFAEQQGFAVNDVYRVMSGSRKGLYGKGHEIAVALGLKANPHSTDID